MKPQEIDSIYNELREDFAIIGLTGALGSGCTTSAKILSNALDNNFFKTFSDHYLSDISNKSSLEEYRLKKIETFINNKTWKSFYHLKVSNLLYCTRCAFRIKKSKLITYHNDIIQFSPKNQNNE